MNVTVMVPRPLQAACEGRASIELGVPSSADLADILHTLLSLYPGLEDFVADEARPMRRHFGVAQSGCRVFLFTASTGPTA